MEVVMKIILDSSTQTFSKPYNFRVNVYTDNDKEYMSIDANFIHEGHVYEFNIPKIDLSEILMEKKSGGFASQMTISFGVVAGSDDSVYATFKDLDFGK
jgi:hypothetical protein